MADYVEEQPNKIDIEIGDQLIKLQSCQIDNIGIYSFKGHVHDKNERNHPNFEGPSGSTCCICPKTIAAIKNKKKKVNFIVNISSQGLLKHISFESQLLIANNLLNPITLVFHLKKVKKFQKQDPIQAINASISDIHEENSGKKI